MVIISLSNTSDQKYALSVYGLIPERVEVFTAATIRKNRSKSFINNFGHEEAKALLMKRYSEIDFDLAKRDVFPILRHEAAVDLWRVDFFRQITADL